MDISMDIWIGYLSINQSCFYMKNMGDSHEIEIDFRSIPPPIRQQYESNSLFFAVRNNDFAKLKSLIECGKSANTRNWTGITLLNCVIEHKRVEMFDYLLSLEELEVDRVDDNYGRSGLLYAMSEAFDEHFVSKLIKRGANIHLADAEGYTALHMAAWDSDNGANVKTGQMMIKNGVDVNSQACNGVTPLYMACERGNLEWIHMLLYYGAIATIPSDKGVLPLAVLSQRFHGADFANLQENLFNHTFEGDGITVKLSTLVAAMAQDSLLFPKLVEIVSEVDYDLADLKYLCKCLTRLKAKHFKVFVEKFGYILQDMCEHYAPLQELIEQSYDLDDPEVKGVFSAMLESDYVTEFVRDTGQSYATIARFLQRMCTHVLALFAKEEELCKTICLMLSYGLSVISDDLDMVYAYYGYCELFKILLHMDITIKVDERKNWFSMAVLYYNPTSSVETFFNEISLFTNEISVYTAFKLLSFYNHHKLKELCLSDIDDRGLAAKASAQAKTLPSVPSLVELSRNKARKFITNRFKIKNSMQFYTVLLWLPIGEMTRKIIALEKKLY